ncbi:50S ribosomal protein L24 [Rhodothermus marinus]|jgi:large subunit ribosomal protein L24|uniref:Large ribosomal subunit protein uL24 n=1 Tax=Rhodothermus marinus (strain ATCC 43812 / DSM 4252 / R-10) TaxID=518766 RepID=D0MGW5_RHOM4|nr:ribosomal protein L24 [Rhodothermus marinus DSM 4252]AEN73932.1 ribosomal protein L24 [Rhodothermus marinus SG0.5JP17-172]MBO2492484.1 50S ribosomal protein L24 [Rhodothermus marinus]BBM69040.1 50S ribosomal protein L24 [Rhodothermus marinus]BBM72018.1 50S ribosomal protein L24 [Rhodothermus marinus]
MPRTKNKQPKLHVKRGDLVRVIAGNDKGKEGRILRVFPKKQRVIVEGVNLRIRHVRPSPQYPQGGRIQQEMPIHVSNVMPLDSNGRPTRVGRKWVEDPATGRGRWVRYAKTTGEELDR